MIAVVSHHWALPGKGEELARRLHGTGEKMRKYPGFISRTNMQAVDDPTHITAVFFWESEEALDGWDKGPDRGQSAREGEPVMDPSKPVYRIRFNVLGEFKPE